MKAIHIGCGLLVAAAVVTTLAGPARAQQATNIQQALDRPVDLTVADSLIGEVFDRLSEKTDVAFVIDPDALAALPYGDQTRVTVKMSNVTLRNALTPLLAPQALRWEIDGEVIRILPSEALYRMNRRATYDELQILGRMHTARIVPPDGGASVVEQMRRVTGESELRLTPHVPGDLAEAKGVADRVLPGAPAEWLDMLCHGRGWTWYLYGTDVIILPREEQVRRQLARRVSLRYENEELHKVLLDLADRARVELRMEPGVLGYLSGEMRHNFNLVMADATVAQALEVISGATGLQFVATDQGVQVEASEQLRVANGEPTRRRERPPFFVRFSIPGPEGTSIEVFMRGEELPDEVVERIQARKAEMIQALGGEAPVDVERDAAPGE